MNSFPSNTAFRYPWRKYQQKVLDELDKHMQDNHLHVVAPPGSGKTVLGLEVAIRLNKPTLILAPTLTIRNQWVQRLCELFLHTKDIPDWISTDIRRPAFLTISTYQGLHSACNGEDIGDAIKSEEDDLAKSSQKTNFSDIIKRLQSVNIGTIVADEAHHLKNEWWNTLFKVKEQLKPFIVGLTATPPYDVTYTEWKRYLDLNGPIDAEISIPELVKEGDLCPHQDCIYFTHPTSKEFELINRFRKNIDDVFQDLSHSEILLNAIEKMPSWNNPEENLEWIYDNLTIYISSIIFLNNNRIPIPDIHLEVIGLNAEEKDSIPRPDYKQLEILLNFFLFQDKDSYMSKDGKENLINRLRHCGAMEKNSIDLLYNKRIDKLLITSKSKMDSIKQIVEIEYDKLQSKLRMVILSDFIRGEHLTNSKTQDNFNKIGVIPIFEQLRLNNENKKKIGVLTGSIVIIPISSVRRFETLCDNMKVTNRLSLTKPYGTDYLIINLTALLRNKIVQIITHLFEEGEIEILIGTKSLLGEGWDAPAINSLILASFIGSFVLSNQMRGRAIRMQKENLQKTSNIWHLVCLDPTMPGGGSDMETMTRRFRSFVGLSNKKEPTIENGLQRMNHQWVSYSAHEIDAANKETISIATNRETLRDRWLQAIRNGVELVEEIKIPFQEEDTDDTNNYKKKKSLYLTKTIAYLIAELLMVLPIVGYNLLDNIIQHARWIRHPKEVLYVVIGTAVIGFLIIGSQSYKTIRLYLKYRDISKDINQIGYALFHALIKQGSIKTPPDRLNVTTYSDDTGAVYSYLKGGSTYEQSIYVDTLQEIVDVIENPRYIIVRKGPSFGSKERKDYHSVPEILGRNKQMAEYFADRWASLVGPCELIYTRTISGRKSLLEARIKSLSAQLSENKHAEQVNKWR